MKVGVYILLFLITISIATATTISLDPCGTTNLYEQGTGGGAEWVMENNCIKLEMRQKNYDPNVEIYDKINNRYFSLMANQLEERSQTQGTKTTTLTSMNLVSDIDEGYIRWTDNQGFTIGYSLSGNKFKFIGTINGWNYQYPDSDLWLDIKYHKNEGDTVIWIPTIVDGIEQPLTTETRTAGQNTFVTERLGRGNNIVIDPVYHVDYSPIPANHLIWGVVNTYQDTQFQTTNDITSGISDDSDATTYNTQNGELAVIERFLADSWSGGTGWNGNWIYNSATSCNVVNTGSPIGSYHLRMYDGVETPDCSVYRSYNNLNQEECYVTFWAKAYALEAGESCTYQYYDGATYNTLLTISYGEDDDVYREYEYEVCKAYGTSADARIRGYTTVSSYLDYCYLDDVRIYDDNGTSINGRWNQTYDPVYQWFARIRKTSTGTTKIIIQPYTNTTAINDTYKIEKNITGTGWFNINITSIVDYQTNTLGLNYTSIRVYTPREQNFSELELRKEVNDTTPPSINSYSINETSITFPQTARFQANITDNVDVDNATFQINGVNYTTTQNNEIYHFDLSPTHNGTTIYEWEKIYTCDILNNCYSESVGLNLTYSTIYEEYINITHTSTQGVDIDYNQTSATINWTTSNPSDSTITYGLSPSNLNNTEYDPTYNTNHEISLTGLTHSTTYYYNVTSTANPTQTIGTFNFTTICAENWIAQYDNISSCRTNNTIITQKTYTDDNSCGTTDDLPVDNGTNTENYCNYCDSDWYDISGDCQENNMQYKEYIDLNNCYFVTNLSEDSPPIDQETWVSCVYFTQDFDCTFNPTPYDTKKITYTCTLPYTGTEYECINKVTHQNTGQLLQTNPEPTTRTDSFLISKEYEDRETFTTTLGLLNAYYRNKDILANNDFIITTTCRDGNTTLTHEEGVNPNKKDLHDTVNWAIWTGNNAWYLVLMFFVLIVVAVIAGSVLREIRRRK